MTATTCVIYCRISLDRTGQAAGVERQEKECRELAAALGMTVVFVYVDNSISAFSGANRPQFEELLTSGAEAIVAWHLDRLVILQKDLERVIDLGINVHTVKAGHLDLSNPAGRAVARTVAAWGQYERELKGERQKAMHRQRRAKGEVWWHARAPIGFTKTGEVDPEGAARLRKAFEDFLVEPNLSARARDLGVAQGGIRRTFMAERNIQIVGEELYDAVLAILSPRAKGPRQHVAMLTGIATCGSCGGTCGTGQQSRAKKNGEMEKAYRCQKGHVWWPQAVVDDHIGELVAEVLEANREEIEARKEDSGDELQQLATDFAAEVISMSEFTSAVERIKRRAAKPAAPMVPWEQMTRQGRRRMCQLLLEAVVLPPRGKGHGNKPPDPERLEIRWRTPA